MRCVCDAGPDGRLLLDPLCEHASELLTPGGKLLPAQSAMSDVDRSRELVALRARR
ncbi:hypothetical protein [Amycolatopsis sulphurea]|uniref:hypothetical protein n=1 Tax=Amycolatopsis sulphurea TaxID=76022 RepID=UPI001472848D|nr:hypothetical protein [Amycolatopsis sulphurea]